MFAERPVIAGQLTCEAGARQELNWGGGRFFVMSPFSVTHPGQYGAWLFVCQAVCLSLIVGLSISLAISGCWKWTCPPNVWMKLQTRQINTVTYLSTQFLRMFKRQSLVTNYSHHLFYLTPSLMDLGPWYCLSVNMCCWSTVRYSHTVPGLEYLD